MFIISNTYFRFPLTVATLMGLSSSTLSCWNGYKDDCSVMCEAAAISYWLCLDAWQVNWEAAGYEDAADYVDACNTWSWEVYQLEKETRQWGATASACRTRAEKLDPVSCNAYLSLDWASQPW